jgi:hypothetical protein
MRHGRQQTDAALVMKAAVATMGAAFIGWLIQNGVHMVEVAMHARLGGVAW